MNRQKGIIAIILLLAFTYAKGQDRIITTQRDTIFCKIVSMSLRTVEYEQRGYDQVPVRKSIPRGQVMEFSLGFRSQDSSPVTSPEEQMTKPVPVPVTKEQETKPVPVPATKEQVTKPVPPPPTEERVTKPVRRPPAEEQVTKPVRRPPVEEEVTKPFSVRSPEKQPQEPFERWRIGFQLGGSYLLNSLPGLRHSLQDAGVNLPYQADNYYKPLRKGMAFDVDVHYLLVPSWGIGLRYSLFSSSTQMDYSVRDLGSIMPIYYSASEKEKFYLNYFGPSLLFQQWLDRDRKFRLNEQLSVGYIYFRNEKQFDPYQYVFVNPNTGQKQYNVLNAGSTFSGNIQLSLEYYPSSWISIGANVGIFPATIYSLKVSDNNNTSVVKKLEKGNYLDMSRLDYSLGVRFHF